LPTNKKENACVCFGKHIRGVDRRELEHGSTQPQIRTCFPVSNRKGKKAEEKISIILAAENT
jgi:hypothetical protein